jgi:hypothetical protein
MATLRIFTDGHIPRAVVDQLRLRGIDVLRCEDVGLKAASDRELLEYATERGYVLLSMDDDVTRLHAEWITAGRTHGGIFYAPMAQFQGQQGIGPLVLFCSAWNARLQQGGGTLEDHLHTQLLFITKR